MKTTIYNIVLAALMVLSGLNVFAYNFEVDGIEYATITSNSVKVMGVSQINEYDIIIPSIVVNEEKEYVVTTISSKFWVQSNEESHLITLHIPGSVELIEMAQQGVYGGYTFFYGINLGYVGNYEVAPDNKYYSSQDGVLYSKDFTVLYRYPLANRNIFLNIINGVEEIFDRAVEDVEALQSVTIPNSVKRINKSAFANCENLKNVVMSESVQIIHTDAFEDCPITSDIILPASLTYIGDDAFGWNGGEDYKGAVVKCYAVSRPNLL